MKFKNKPWYSDYMRIRDNKTFSFFAFIKDFIFYHRVRYMVYFRRAQKTKFKPLKFYYEYKLFRLCRKYGIEIKTNTQIGEGFCMIHPYNITVSPFAVLGKNVNMYKGSTIGVNTSNPKGAPVIGDFVQIGINSTVIGGITIGDDVLIAPNTLVNTDVPSHSVVIGNPCRIISKENATGQFIWNPIDTEKDTGK
jgi:serine O-acetyltransferase